MKAFGVLLFLCLSISLAAPGAAGEDPPLRITITYDNVAATDDTKADWGFACLVEGRDKTILFDAGTKEDLLARNLDALGVELENLDAVFLSHIHRDHTGGLAPVLARNPGVAVYMPESFPEGFATQVRQGSAKPARIGAPAEIFPGIHSTGDLGGEIPEQALIVDAAEGLVVITGCAHPGIVDIVKRAKETVGRDVHLVLGGFHLLSASDDEVDAVVAAFKELGVANVGPGHCTGEAAIARFKQAYGDHCHDLGTGRILTVNGVRK